MERLSVILKLFNKVSPGSLQRIYRIALLSIFFPALLSVSYCFREDVLKKLEMYNSEDHPGIPEVSSVYPADGTVDAGVSSTIDVTFKDSINILTVNSSTFSINGGTVTGSYSYDPVLKTVKFTPASGLAYGTLYSVTLTTGIKNINGESMVSDYTWSFNTVAQHFISVLSVLPSNGYLSAAISSDITVEFSEDIDISTVTSSTFTVNDVTVPAIPVPVSGVYSYDPLLRIVMFTPDVNFSYNTPYSVKLTAGIMNPAGEYMVSDYIWSFTTAVQFFINVVSVLPVNGSADIPIGTNIDVTFNDIIDDTTLTSSTFTLNPGAVTGVYSFNPLTKTAVFNPDTDLPPSTLFTVNLTTGITNAFGDSMASAYSWTFTTSALNQPRIYLLSPLGVNIASGKTYDFGNLVNPSTRSINFTAGNSGSGSLDITGVSISSGDYSTSLTPVSIGVNSNEVFAVVFQPDTTVDLKNATMTITNNDPLTPVFTLKLTGVSLAVPEPEIQITGNGVIMVNAVSTVDFGTISAGGTGSVTLVLHNIGSSDLSVSDAAFGGTDPGLFSTDFTVPSTVVPGDTLSFNISFSSLSAINARAVITFQNNDSDEAPFVIKLKGRVK